MFLIYQILVENFAHSENIVFMHHQQMNSGKYFVLFNGNGLEGFEKLL